MLQTERATLTKYSTLLIKIVLPITSFALSKSLPPQHSVNYGLFLSPPFGLLCMNVFQEEVFMISYMR